MKCIRDGYHKGPNPRRGCQKKCLDSCVSQSLCDGGEEVTGFISQRIIKREKFDLPEGKPHDGAMVGKSQKPNFGVLDGKFKSLKQSFVGIFAVCYSRLFDESILCDLYFFLSQPLCGGGVIWKDWNS